MHNKASYQLLLIACFYHAIYAFRVNLRYVIAKISKNSLLETGTRSKIESGIEFESRCSHINLIDCNCIMNVTNMTICKPHVETSHLYHSIFHSFLYKNADCTTSEAQL